MDNKPMLGMPPGTLLEAALGEGLFGKVRTGSEQDSPWKEARTKEGQVYYFHAVTRQTTWIKPPPEFAAAAPMTGAIGRSAPQSRSTVNAGAQAQAAIRAAQNSVAASKEGDDAGGASSQGPVGANLFVYHIPNSWDDHILRQHFEHFGKILSCRVTKDDNGRPRGFGFVSYDEPGGAAAAIAGMHGFPVEGKWLKVQLKKGDEQQMGGGQPGGMPGVMDANQAAVVSATPPPAPPAPPPPGPPSAVDTLKGAFSGGKGDSKGGFGDSKGGFGKGGFGDKGYDKGGKGKGKKGPY